MLVALFLLAGCTGNGSEAPAPAAQAGDPATPETSGPGPTGGLAVARDTMSAADLLANPQRYLSSHQNVRGTCLGWGGPALGAQPSTRSDWQIGDSATALWVVGSLPAGCTGEGGGGVTTIRAYVAADTVPVRIGRAAEQRVYLIHRK